MSDIQIKNGLSGQVVNDIKKKGSSSDTELLYARSGSNPGSVVWRRDRVIYVDGIDSSYITLFGHVNADRHSSLTSVNNQTSSIFGNMSDKEICDSGKGAFFRYGTSAVESFLTIEIPVGEQKYISSITISDTNAVEIKGWYNQRSMIDNTTPIYKKCVLNLIGGKLTNDVVIKVTFANYYYLTIEPNYSIIKSGTVTQGSVSVNLANITTAWTGYFNSEIKVTDVIFDATTVMDGYVSSREDSERAIKTYNMASAEVTDVVRFSDIAVGGTQYFYLLAHDDNTVSIRSLKWNKTIKDTDYTATITTESIYWMRMINDAKICDGKGKFIISFKDSANKNSRSIGGGYTDYYIYTLIGYSLSESASPYMQSKIESTSTWTYSNDYYNPTLFYQDGDGTGSLERWRDSAENKLGTGYTFRYFTTRKTMSINDRAEVPSPSSYYNYPRWVGRITSTKLGDTIFNGGKHEWYTDNGWGGSCKVFEFRKWSNPNEVRHKAYFWEGQRTGYHISFNRSYVNGDALLAGENPSYELTYDKPNPTDFLYRLEYEITYYTVSFTKGTGVGIAFTNTTGANSPRNNSGTSYAYGSSIYLIVNTSNYYYLEDSSFTERARMYSGSNELCYSKNITLGDRDYNFGTINAKYISDGNLKMKCSYGVTTKSTDYGNGLSLFSLDFYNEADYANTNVSSIGDTLILDPTIYVWYEGYNYVSADDDWEYERGIFSVPSDFLFTFSGQARPYQYCEWKKGYLTSSAGTIFAYNATDPSYAKTFVACKKTDSEIATLINSNLPQCTKKIQIRLFFATGQVSQLMEIRTNKGYYNSAESRVNGNGCFTFNNNTYYPNGSTEENLFLNWEIDVDYL